MNQETIEQTVRNLRKNNFNVYLAETPLQACQIFMEEILPSLNIKTYASGDSITLKETGVLEELQKNPDLIYYKTFSSEYSYSQKIHWRRQALLTDLFLTGTNALTQKGQLVNLDMVGNRVGGITFGPENVVIFVGTNKICPDLDSAMKRIREIAAPQNAARHKGFKTPCVSTGKCHDCQSPDRICNTWTICEKSYPKGRISVVLIKQELGL